MQRHPNGKILPHSYPACMIRLCLDDDGYLRAPLCYLDRKTVQPGVHQLVATLFLEEKSRPDQTHVNHIDGNKQNNTPENLEWASPYENNLHARQTGLARLGTSQSIHGKVLEWNKIFGSKTKTNAALGRNPGYIEYHQEHNLPIIDKNSGQEVHVEWIEREGNDEYYRKTS